MKERIEADRLIIQWNVAKNFEKSAKDKFFYSHSFKPFDLEAYMASLYFIVSYIPVAIWKVKIK